MDYQRLFSKQDLNAFWALFADNLANLLIITGVCRFVFHMDPEIVFGRILPGAGVAILSGALIYARMAHRLAAREQRTTVTALPYGISTPVMFVYLFGVIGPIYWSTQDPLLAWQVGAAAGVLGGCIEALGAVTGPTLQRLTPRAGMLETLAGIALVFIGTVPLSEVYEHPLIGMVSLAFILWGLVGRFRLPLGLPAGLSALVAGTLVALLLGEARLSLDGAGFYPPVPYFNDVLVGLRHLFAHPQLLSVLIPVQIYNFIETMNNVESAASVGDHYHVGHCQLADGAGTIVGGLFGSPFPTTVYIGHPAYKHMKARSGYALGVGLVFFLGSMFGMVACLGDLIPAVVVAPILIFVSVTMVSTAFRACKPEHGVAVALSLLPHVSGILTVKWGSLLNALRDLKIGAPELTDPARWCEPMERRLRLSRARSLRFAGHRRDLSAPLQDRSGRAAERSGAPREIETTRDGGAPRPVSSSPSPSEQANSQTASWREATIPHRYPASKPCWPAMPWASCASDIKGGLLSRW